MAREPESSMGEASAARTFLDAAAWGATDGAVTALRRALPRGLRPAALKRGHGGAPPARAASEPPAARASPAGAPASLADIASSFIFGAGADVGEGAGGAADRLEGEKQSERRHTLLSDAELATTDAAEGGSIGPSHNAILEGEDSTSALSEQCRASASSVPGSSDDESISDAFPLRHGTVGAAEASCGSIAFERRPNAASESESGTPADCRAANRLDGARWLAAQSNFPGAIRGCLSVLDGPKQAIDLLRALSFSWEQFVSEQARAREGALAALEAELRELQGAHRAWQGELAAETGKRKQAEEQLKEQERELYCLGERARQQERRLEGEALRCKAVIQEATLSQRREKRALAERDALRGQLQDLARQPPSFESVARRVAEFEASPLVRLAPPDRPAAKRRLLVKWHPDKQPSGGHAALATQVMQEMQNRPEWCV